MKRKSQARASGVMLLALLALSTITATPARSSAKASCRKVRFATYNTSLNRNKAGELLQELQSGVSEQASHVAAILQTIRPDVVVINEFDYEPDGAAVKAFQDNFLSVPQATDLKPLRYPYVFAATVNTGVPSGRDFDHDGKTDGPGDAFGFGNHPGQYGMVLLSQFPIDAEANRTFQYFLWKDMPGALLPTDPATRKPWYSPEDLEVFRLSSKSHWDVPLEVEVSPGTSKRVHMLLHHPTPPAFDGPEGRNLLRNHDEIRLFADYVGCPARTDRVVHPSSIDTVTSSASSSRRRMHGESVMRRRVQADAASNAKQQHRQQACQVGAYLYDDAGKKGGLDPGASFVIAGDHNADPLDGNSYNHAIMQLLRCANITASFTPTSEGGKEAGNRRRSDRTPPETKTSTFDLRVDYVLPSRDLKVVGGAVFWPVKAQQPQATWVQASDHRPVYLDVEVCVEADALH